MNTRHATNKNLTLLNESHFNGCSVYASGQLIQDYLWRIDEVINKALNEHPRTLVIRFDLHLPAIPNCIDYPIEYGSNVITRFIESFKAQIKADILKKMREGKRVHPCSVRYVWVKERNNAAQAHYHVALMLNNDTYNRLGNYQRPGNNNVTRIINAWASALRIESHVAQSLVHFPQSTPVYYLDRNAQTFPQDYQAVFNRLSYFAKSETKHFGDHSNSFGCSRK